MFENIPSVNGKPERIIDSTGYLPGNDSSEQARLWDVSTVNFKTDDSWAGWSSSSAEGLFWDGIDSAFDVTGKFYRSLLLDEIRKKGWKHGQTSYEHQPEYNIENDIITGEGGVRFTYTFRYDENCDLLQFNKMEPDLRLGKKYIFTYAGKNKLIGCRLYDGNDQLLKEATYTYDATEKETGYIIYGPDHTVLVKCLFTYESFDQKGNWQKRIKYKGGKVVAVTVRRIEYY